MTSRQPTSWMWGDALSMLEQAERLHRQFFRSAGGGHCWEPPADIVEHDDAFVILIALPGVPAEAVSVTFDVDGVRVAGARRLPASRSARIHRLEIPYGRFERRIALPLHALEPETPRMVDGCLVLTLRKLREAL